MVEVVLLAEGYVGGLAEVVHEGEAGEAFYAAGGGVGGFAAGGAVEAGVFVGVEDIRVEAFGADEVVVLDCVVLAELDVACVVVEGRGVLLDVSACGADEGVAGGAGELDGGVAGGAFGAERAVGGGAGLAVFVAVGDGGETAESVGGEDEVGGALGALVFCLVDLLAVEDVFGVGAFRAGGARREKTGSAFCAFGEICVSALQTCMTLKL